MKLAGAIVVVTGGANGIGRALCERFAQEGVAHVVVADIDTAAAAAVAQRIGGTAMACDVAREPDIAHLVEQVEARHGPIALFCSNAGIAAGYDLRSENPAAASDADWARSWAVNVMAHVYAARALVPRMKARGGGSFLQTISAAGLLSQIGSAVYSTTKHAAVGFAETLAIAHRDDGIRVSILCPQGVDTAMLRGLPQGPQALDGIISPEAVADAAVAGLARDAFLILPHPTVATYMRNKAADYDRWIGGMAKLQRRLRQPGA
jgi:NAD(P)-dependent dehydrogenase (short-subunit alcohol dehydrogenase family)